MQVLRSVLNSKKGVVQHYQKCYMCLAYSICTGTCFPALSYFLIKPNWKHVYYSVCKNFFFLMPKSMCILVRVLGEGAVGGLDRNGLIFINKFLIFNHHLFLLLRLTSSFPSGLGVLCVVRSRWFQFVT